MEPLSRASIALALGLADALRQELGTGGVQLELFAETLPLPAATRLAIRSLVLQANHHTSDGPELDANIVIRAIEGLRHSDPTGALFGTPERVRKLRVLAAGLAGTQALDARNAARVVGKLLLIESRGRTMDLMKVLRKGGSQEAG